MKDDRFIELLNLYLDQQISEFEAAELEAEVTRNPERRRMYNEYCRLQRACCLLGDGARAQASGKEMFLRSLRDAERKIARPRGRSVWRTTYAYAGFFGATAAAACVAVLVMVGNRPGTGGVIAQPGIAERPATPPVTWAANVVTAPDAVPVFVAQPVLDANALSVARNARELEIASTDREALEWMQRVNLRPAHRIDPEEPVFETSRPTLHPDNRVFRSRRGLQGNAEFTAFQFQR